MVRSFCLAAGCAALVLSACGSTSAGVAETQAGSSTTGVGTTGVETTREEATTSTADAGSSSVTAASTDAAEPEQATTTTTGRTTTTEETTTTTLPLVVTASLSRCDTNFRCTYSFSGTGATPSGDLELVIVNGAGVDIQSLPDFSYPTGYSATSDGTFSATNFATTLGEPDVHEFRFRDVATGRVASASIRFAHPAPLEVLQASSSRSRCPHDPGCSYELSVRGLTPRGAVQLRIRDGNGVDINTLPGYRYPIDWTANDSGTLATGTFQTGTAGPDTHTFEFVDVATGSRTTTALVFE